MSPESTFDSWSSRHEAAEIRREELFQRIMKDLKEISILLSKRFPIPTTPFVSSSSSSPASPTINSATTNLSVPLQAIQISATAVGTPPSPKSPSATSARTFPSSSPSTYTTAITSFSTSAFLSPAHCGPVSTPSSPGTSTLETSELEEIPSGMVQPQKDNGKNKSFNRVKHGFDMEKLNAMKLPSVEQIQDPTQKSLQEIIETMQFKGLLKGGQVEDQRIQSRLSRKSIPRKHSRDDDGKKSLKEIHPSEFICKKRDYGHGWRLSRTPDRKAEKSKLKFFPEDNSPHTRIHIQYRKDVAGTCNRPDAAFVKLDKVLGTCQNKVFDPGRINVGDEMVTSDLEDKVELQDGSIDAYP